VADGTTLVVPFERNPLHVRADNYDRVYIYVYCPEIERGFFSAPVYRREQRLAVVLPESFAGREVQVWGMVQDAAGRWSQTLYIGHGPIENTETETHPSVSVKNGATSPLSGSNGDMACDRSGANLGEELNGRGGAISPNSGEGLKGNAAENKVDVQNERAPGVGIIFSPSLT
jgi:hypothetical protein